jgi:hypothetical protein
MSRGALDAPRLVDDPFEYPRNRVAFERAARMVSVRPHVMQHLRLALGLIHLEAKSLLDPPNLERAVRTLAEQLNQPFVKPIDLPP